MSLFLDTTTDGTELRRKKVSLLIELLFFLREYERGGTVLASDGLISHIYMWTWAESNRRPLQCECNALAN